MKGDLLFTVKIVNDYSFVLKQKMQLLSKISIFSLTEEKANVFYSKKKMSELTLNEIISEYSQYYYFFFVFPFAMFLAKYIFIFLFLMRFFFVITFSYFIFIKN